MAGYSRRSLVEKLGIKSHTRIAILNAPRGYRATLGALPPGVRVTSTIRGTSSFIHVFSRSHAELRSSVAALLRALQPAAALCISWHKKSSGLLRDLRQVA